MAASNLRLGPRNSPEEPPHVKSGKIGFLLPATIRFFKPDAAFATGYISMSRKKKSRLMAIATSEIRYMAL